MVNVVISKKALGAEDGARVARKVAAATLDTPRLHIPVYDVLGFGFAPPLTLLYAPGVLVPGLFGDLLVAAAFGKEEAMIAGLPLDVGPIVDDRPFFFQLLGVKNLPSVFGETKKEDYYLRGFRAHTLFFVAILLAAVALTLVPVMVTYRGSLRAKDAAPRLLYFGALGTGYLFVEIALMQKTALLLGHPTYSIAVTLLTLLLGSGAGSFVAGRLAWPPRVLVRRAVIAIVFLLIVEQWGLHAMCLALMPLPFALRAALLVLAVAPLGFVMGIPFPIGLREEREVSGAAWALGINAFSSVVASLLAVPTAMFFSFSAVAVLAMLLYAVAGLVAPRGAVTS